jgi:branched-chain amino acid transport system permease protein
VPDAIKKIPPFVRQLIAIFVIGAVLLVVNGVVEGPRFGQYRESILIFCGINIVLAVALNIVNGFTGQFSLGHIGFYAIGAYVTAAFATYGHDRFFSGLPIDGSSPSILHQIVPVFVLTTAAGLAAAVAGLVVGLPSLRLRGDYLAIITLGFAQIIQVIIRNIKAVDGATSFNGIAHGNTTILTPHLTNFLWVYVAVAVILWVAYALRFSTHGLAFLAVRDDEIAAESMGINTTRYKVIAFLISAYFTGVAGSLFALYLPSLSNDQFSFVRSIDILVMVVLGGLGSISGVTLAAILLTTLPEFLRSVDQYRLVIYPLLLILLMLTRPQGIFGRDEMSKTWLMGQWKAIRGVFVRKKRPSPSVPLPPG